MLEAKTDPETELYGIEAKNLLKTENVTSEMLLFFISSVKVFSEMKPEIKCHISDGLMTELEVGENG